MSGFVDVIGLISGVLGIIQFASDQFPPTTSVDSTVRVTVGLDTNGGLDNGGGDLPDIRLFNEAGTFLGLAQDPGKVENGGFADVVIKHEGKSTQQPTYALFSANNDAICIAYVTITLPSADKYSWVGDWGKQCGASWYYSNVYIGSTGVTPDCMWIDANNDQPQSGFQVHWPEFFNPPGSSIPADPAGKAEKVDFFCSQQPAFKYYNFAENQDPRDVAVWPPKAGRSEEGLETREPLIGYGKPKQVESAKFRRETTEKRQAADPQAGRLVVSDNEKHSAEELCQSKTSKGPDFVNTATGTFCRMSDKKQFSVCDASIKDNCFSMDTKEVITGGVSARESPYTQVLDWTATKATKV
ncbi:hypothetical protein F4804DRAFT_342403 [Jackrogersella minutella]|nr:hypothetical protein F4804DRAFT_342403 [Jackrogersella minutella]